MPGDEITGKDLKQWEVSVLLEEYKSCRSEIVEQVKLRAQALTIAVAFIVSLAGAATTLLGKQSAPGQQSVFSAGTASWLLLMVPVCAFTLGMWIVHKDCMIFYLAAYINDRIKLRLEDIVYATGPEHIGIHGLLNWDSYRARGNAAGAVTQYIRKVTASFPHVVLAASSVVALSAVRQLPVAGSQTVARSQSVLWWTDVAMTAVFVVSSLWVGITCEGFRNKYIERASQ